MAVALVADMAAVPVADRTAVAAAPDTAVRAWVEDIVVRVPDTAVEAVAVVAANTMLVAALADTVAVIASN